MRPSTSSRSPSASEVPVRSSIRGVRTRPAAGARTVVRPSSSSSSASSRRSASPRMRCSRSSAASPRLAASDASRSAVAASAAVALPLGRERRGSENREQVASLDPASLPDRRPARWCRPPGPAPACTPLGRKHRVVSRDPEGPADQGHGREEQQGRVAGIHLDPPAGQREQRLLAGRQGAQRVHHRHLVVELRVAQGDAGLVGQDRGDLPLGLAGEFGRADSKSRTPSTPSSSFSGR